MFQSLNSVNCFIFSTVVPEV